MMAMKTQPDCSSPEKLRADDVKVVQAVQLLGEGKVVVIEHKGERYELRLTRNDKLILTK